MGAVAVLWVCGCDVDVPSAAQGVKFWGPEVGGVVCVRGWGPVLVGVQRLVGDGGESVYAAQWVDVAYQTGPFLNLPSSKKSVILSAYHNGTLSPPVNVK